MSTRVPNAAPSRSVIIVRVPAEEPDIYIKPGIKGRIRIKLKLDPPAKARPKPSRGGDTHGPR